MAIDWGEALGEGAEAASGAFHQTLNYKTALALQQIRVGIEKEKLAMDKDRQAMDMERIQQAIDLGKIEEQEAQADLKAKLREERLVRKGEHFISQAKSLEKIAGRETPSGKRPWEAEFIPEISPGRKLEAFEMAGRTAPLAIESLAEEEALTPFELRKRKADVEYTEAQTAGLERGPRRTVEDRSRDLYVETMGKIRAGTATDTDLDQLSFITGNYRREGIGVKTSDIKNIYSIASQGYTEKEWQDLDPVDVIRAVNITGRKNVENWVDQVAPYRVKFKNIRLGRDEYGLIHATPEQIDLIRRAEQDRDSGKITQVDFEEALRGILESE